MIPSRVSRSVAVALIALAAALICGCHSSSAGGENTPAAGLSATATGPVADLLAELPVKGRAPKTGYSRARFGDAWTDDVATDGGHNGCDTRDDILRRDLGSLGLRPGSGGCTVQTGVLRDPYTGTTIDFTRGVNTSAAIQIDHLVALSDAWQTGAQQLTATVRQNMANDPLNLLAVQGQANQNKSDGDAATWLPPNKSERCAYVSRQIAVKQRYYLWVTPAEKAAMTQVLLACPGEDVPTTASTAVPALSR